MHCRKCGHDFVKSAVQNTEGDWTIAHICGCRIDPDKPLIDEFERLGVQIVLAAKKVDDRMRQLQEAET